MASSKQKIHDIATASLRGATLTVEEIETVGKVSPMSLIADYGFAIEEAHMIINNLTIQSRKHKRTGLTVSESRKISRLPKHLQAPLRRALIECSCEEEPEEMMMMPFPSGQISSYHPVQSGGALEFEDSDNYEESGMIKSNLYSIMTKAQSLHDTVKDGDDLPEWVQEKIAVCDEYMDVINDYLKYEYKTSKGQIGESKKRLTEAQKLKLIREFGVSDIKELGLDITSLGLDVVGFVGDLLGPETLGAGFVLGETADGINFIMNISREKYLDAVFSFISLIPAVGDIVGKGGKITSWIAKNFPRVYRAGIKYGPDVIEFAKFIKKHKKKIEQAIYALEKQYVWFRGHTMKLIGALNKFYSESIEPLLFSEDKMVNTIGESVTRRGSKPKNTRLSSISKNRIGESKSSHKLEEGLQDTLLDVTQLTLDAVGALVDPAGGWGAPIDIANALISTYRKDYLGAVFSVISAVPIVGDAIGKGGKAIKWMMENIPTAVRAYEKYAEPIIKFAKVVGKAKGDVDKMIAGLKANEKLKAHVPQMQAAFDKFYQDIIVPLSSAKPNVPLAPTQATA